MAFAPSSTLLRALLGACVLGAEALAGSYYREADSYSTTRDPDPPRYVGPATQSPASFLNGFKWLDVGLDYRLRYEFRDDDIRRDVEGVDEPLLHRTRLYLGVRELVDPLRFAVEIQDSHRYGSRFAKDNRDVNELEAIRAYAELYLKGWLTVDARGNARPISLRYGHHNFEFLDRRLLGNNQWRNTANAFRGWHGRIGQEANDWQVDLLSVQPLERLLYDPDRPAEGKRLWGAIGHWRAWSEVATFEPFYLRLDDRSGAGGGRAGPAGGGSPPASFDARPIPRRGRGLRRRRLQTRSRRRRRRSESLAILMLLRESPQHGSSGRSESARS
jgi:hypothetical protein